MGEDRKKAKVFEIDEYTWWVGYDAESVKQAYLAQGDVFESDLEQEPRELGETELKRLKFFADIAHPSKGHITFAERLQQVIDSEDAIPDWFAVAEC